MSSPSSPKRFWPSTETVFRARLFTVWIRRVTSLKRQWAWKAIFARYTMHSCWKEYTGIERSLLKSSCQAAVQCLLLTDFGMVQENIQIREKGSEVWVRRGGEFFREQEKGVLQRQHVPEHQLFLGLLLFIYKWKWLHVFLLHTGSGVTDCIKVGCGTGSSCAHFFWTAPKRHGRLSAAVTQVVVGALVFHFSWLSSILFWVNQRPYFSSSPEKFWACLKSSDRPWLSVLGSMNTGNKQQSHNPGGWFHYSCVNIRQLCI